MVVEALSMPEPLSLASSVMLTAPLRLVVSSSTSQPEANGSVLSTRTVTVLLAPVLPTRSVGRKTISWTPSSKVNVSVSLVVLVHVESVGSR